MHFYFSNSLIDIIKNTWYEKLASGIFTVGFLLVSLEEIISLNLILFENFDFSKNFPNLTA